MMMITNKKAMATITQVWVVPLLNRSLLNSRLSLRTLEEVSHSVTIFVISQPHQNLLYHCGNQVVQCRAQPTPLTRPPGVHQRNQTLLLLSTHLVCWLLVMKIIGWSEWDLGFSTWMIESSKCLVCYLFVFSKFLPQWFFLIFWCTDFRVAGLTGLHQQPRANHLTPTPGEQSMMKSTKIRERAIKWKTPKVICKEPGCEALNV